MQVLITILKTIKRLKKSSIFYTYCISNMKTSKWQFKTQISTARVIYILHEINLFSLCVINKNKALCQLLLIPSFQRMTRKQTTTSSTEYLCRSNDPHLNFSQKQLSYTSPSSHKQSHFCHDDISGVGLE